MSYAVKEVPIGMVIFVMTRVLKVMIHASNAQKYMIVLKRTRSHCQEEKVKAPELGWNVFADEVIHPKPSEHGF